MACARCIAARATAPSASSAHPPRSSAPRSRSSNPPRQTARRAFARSPLPVHLRPFTFARSPLPVRAHLSRACPALRWRRCAGRCSTCRRWRTAACSAGGSTSRSSRTLTDCSKRWLARTRWVTTRLRLLAISPRPAFPRHPVLPRTAARPCPLDKVSRWGRGGEGRHPLSRTAARPCLRDKVSRWGRGGRVGTPCLARQRGLVP